tara:strand:- start:814 stop:1521 length:708 start_codon:yes stop_codon:yes gene_type:complete
MKLVILAGGYGTRIGEETKIKPKPLIKIGNKPIIWHIMKIYSHFGIKNFVICLGYKGALLKKELNKIITNENWNVKYVDTGLKTMTGGRIKRIKKFVNNEKYFFMTYGDGLCDININKLIRFHIKKKKIATLTAVRYRNPKGVVTFDNHNKIKKIKEKPIEYINGGFYILDNKIFNYLKGDKTIFEKDSLSKLSKNKQLIGYRHKGFWACMDTTREKIELNKIWNSKAKAWKIWT